MQISGEGMMRVAVLPSWTSTVVPPVDPFGVRTVSRTLPLGLRWPLAFGGSLLGLTIVSWCRAGPLFLGVRVPLSGAVVPDAGADVGVLRHAKPFCGVSPACRTLAWRNSPRRGAWPLWCARCRGPGRGSRDSAPRCALAR